MTRWLPWLIGLTAVLALIQREPLLALAALLLALLAGITALWDRYALAAVTYERTLGQRRLFVGEATDLTVSLTNAKPLPLAWLNAEDEFPQELHVAKGRMAGSHKAHRRLLVNTLSLFIYERVRRHYRVTANHRGAFLLGPVQLEAGDLFGLRRHEKTVEVIDELIVYPRLVPVDALELARAAPFGEESTLRRIADDPLRVVGVRPYVPGDNPRHLHWKATARRGELQTKTYEPGAAPTTAIFLDVQTVRGAPGLIEDYLEYAIVAAASLAQHRFDAGDAVGLYVNAPRRYSSQRICLAPARRPDHWPALLEALARVLEMPSLPFERLIRLEQPSLPDGATVIALSATPGPGAYAALLDLQRAGHPVWLLVVGDEEPPPVPPALRWAALGGSAAYARLESLAVTP